MKPFTRLPGFTPSPAGLERTLLRLTPRIFLMGTLIPLTLLAGAHAFDWLFPALVPTERLTFLDICMAAVVILHWTVVFTAALAAFIVLVMKGPAYVADAYPLDDKDDGTEDLPDSLRSRGKEAP